MKKLIILLILGGAGFGAYKLWFQKKETEAFLAYRRFADALANYKDDVAYPMAEGAAAAQVEREKRMWNMVGSGLRGAVLDSSYELVSETPKDGGKSVEIVVLQAVQKNQGNSAFGAEVKHKHTATMSKASGQWKVLSYKDDVLDK